MFENILTRNKNYVSDKIESIRTFALYDIPEMIEDGDVLTLREYKNLRFKLNYKITELLLGIDSLADRHGNIIESPRYNRPLPNMSQFSQLISIFEEYISDVEIPFLESMEKDKEEDDDDEDEAMGIPNKSKKRNKKNKSNKNKRTENIDYSSKFPSFDKITKRQVNDCLGKNSQYAFVKSVLNLEDLTKIASIGEILRKRKNRNTKIIIGSVVVVIVAGVITANVIANGNRDHIEEMDVDDTFDEVPDLPIVEDEFGDNCN